MKPNPPIPGHELLYEGHSQRTYGPDEMYDAGHRGGCRCGAKPDGWPNLSAGAVKRWHRDVHKVELREARRAVAGRESAAAAQPAGSLPGLAEATAPTAKAPGLAAKRDRGLDYERKRT